MPMPRAVPVHALALLLALAAGAASALSAQSTAAGGGHEVREAPVRYDRDLLPPEFHRARRDAVRSALPPGSVAVVLGGAEAGGALDDVKEYIQDPYLYYLTGSLEPGSALLLAPDGVDLQGGKAREILFVPPRDHDTEIWLGRRFGPERAQRELGVEAALPNTRFRDLVEPILAQPGRKVFLLPFPPAVPPKTALAEQIGAVAEAAQVNAGAFDDVTLGAILDGLREVKTPEEIALLQRAVDITGAALREAIGSMEPGWAEYDIEAVLEYTFRRMGSERPGFPSIVGSGENSVLLHYDTNRRVTRSGDLVVMDIGASYREYTADVTRTVPVDGRFTKEQRAIYEIVLEAQEAAIAAVRAGASFGAPGEAAGRVMARGLAKLGLIRGPEDYAGLRRFFPHGTSHYLGLQVHDVGSYRALRAGAVVTIEPGIYIPPSDDIDPRWWDLGVRIEDDVLVTDGKPVVLSAGIPKDPDELEALMAAGRTAAQAGGR
ncbi:MAG: aminopeptidase P N-terminal domain-containing protein [Longimicrobiales bacterium]